MEIIKENIASIKHNDASIDGRVQLSIAYCPISCTYAIVTDSGENAGDYSFAKIGDAEKAIGDLWGRSSAWDLQYK